MAGPSVAVGYRRGVSLIKRFAAFLLVAGLSSEPAVADVVRLRDGGEVRGTIVSQARSDQVAIETLAGIRVVVPFDDVIGLVRRSLDAERYVDKSREVADRVDARWALAEWCRKRRLTSERDEQLRAILALDSDHEKSRLALGYVERDGRWLSENAAKKADGLVQVGRRWVTPAEADLLESIDESSELAKAWFPKAVSLAKQLPKADFATRRKFLDAIATNNDPNAVAAWFRTFASHPDIAVRTACIVSLSNIATVSVVRPLAALAVEDIDPTVRQAATDGMPREHAALAARVLTQWLTDENNSFVRTAATAIEAIGHPVATPQLIRALVTGHWRMVQVVDSTPGFASGGGNIGFGPQQSTLPPEVEIGLRTGQYPFGVNVAPPSNRVRTKRVRVEVRNEQVLKALVAMTGQNFGYDERQWSAWFRRSEQ